VGVPRKKNIPISPGSQGPDFITEGDFAVKAISLVGIADEFHCGACRPVSSQAAFPAASLCAFRAHRRYRSVK
jgi:hypothetical protein